MFLIMFQIFKKINFMFNYLKKTPRVSKKKLIGKSFKYILKKCIFVNILEFHVFQSKRPLKKLLLISR